MTRIQDAERETENMSDTTNPFAVAVEALRVRERHLHNAMRVTEDHFSPEAAQEYGVRLTATRDALALFERLAAVEVEVKQTSPTAVVCQAYYDDGGMTCAYGQRLMYNSEERTVSLQPAEYAEAGMVAMAHAAQECRRRNTLAAERAEAEETEVRG